MQNKYCIYRVEKCMIKEEIEVNATSLLSKKKLGLLGTHTKMQSEIKKGELKSPNFFKHVNDINHHSSFVINNYKQYK